jgi:hypothetical protein
MTASGTHNFYNTQHTFASPLVGDEAISIRPFRDLGEWTLQSSRYYPVNADASSVADLGAEKLQLFYKANDNPFIATLTTNSLIGINPVLNTAGTYTDRTLGVFETEPTTSLLDIFWETSTAGLISDLNTAVDTGNEGPVSFTQIGFNLTEGMATGTQITNYFELVRSDGNPTADASEINMSNLRVVDGAGVNRSSDFQLVANIANPNTQFAIITATTFYYGSNAGTQESYMFTIDCVANNIQNTISFTGQLSNTTPSILGNMFVPSLMPNNSEPFSYYFPGPQPYELDLGTLTQTSGAPNQICNFKIQNGTLIASKINLETLVVLSIEGGPQNVGQDLTTITPLCINYTTSNGFTLSYSDLYAPLSPLETPEYIYNVKIYDTIVDGGIGQYLPGGSTAIATEIGNNILEFSFKFKLTK